MTGHDDFDRLLAGWFESDAAAPAPAGGLDRVLDATRRRKPRPAWLAGPGSQWVGEAPDAGPGAGWGSLARLDQRWSTAFILGLVIAAIVGAAILVGALLIQPSPLPTGRLGHLAYGLDGDIFVADWDGRNAVRIADGFPGVGPDACGSFWGEGRMWSPDGRYLAYRSAWGDACDGPRDGKVLISDPTGHVLASVPGTGWLLSWSPDSTRIATWVGLSQTIGIYGIDGVRQALLALPPEYRVLGDFDPVWSPDGRSLLIKLSPPSPSEVWEVPIDGGTPRPVPTDDPRSNWGAAYSRDGARVAFNESGFLVVAAADGSQRRLLAQAGTPRPLESIVWSPTGDRVAFTWGENLSFLRVIEVASGNVWELTSASQIEPVRFSPEGDRILFWRSGRNDASLWSANVDSSEPQRPLSVGGGGVEDQVLVTGTGWGDWQFLPADH